MLWIKLKCTFIALAVMLIFSTTVTYAEQQDAALQPSCEKLRLQCQKDWAEPDSSGVPVTSPEKTKLCWDIYKRCMNADSSSKSMTSASEAEAKTSALQAMKHFQTRSLGELTYIEDCYVNGADVKCTGKFEKLPAGIIRFESTTTGRLTGRVMTGTEKSRSDLAASGSPCSFHQEDSWPVTVTLGPNNEATVQVGSVQSRIIGSGAGNCAGTQNKTYPGSTTKATWKVIE